MDVIDNEVVVEVEKYLTLHTDTHTYTHTNKWIGAKKNIFKLLLQLFKKYAQLGNKKPSVSLPS